MPSIWIDFVKTWAKKYNLSYGCALSNPQLKTDYKKFKENKLLLKNLKVEPIEIASPSSVLGTNKGIVIKPSLKEKKKRGRPSNIKNRVRINLD